MNRGRGWYNDHYQHILAGKGISTSFGKSKYKDMKKKLSQESNEYVDIKPPKELRNIYWNDAGDLDKIIKLFWWCNAHNNHEWFKFDKAFELSEDLMRNKLGEHNRLPESEQREFLEEQLNYEPYMFGSLIENHMKDHNDFTDSLVDREKIRSEMYDDLNDVWRNIQQRYDQPITDLDEIARQYGYENWYDQEFVMDYMIEEFGLGHDIIDSFVDLEMYQDETYDEIRKTYDKLKDYESYDKVNLFDNIVDTVHHTGHIFDYYHDIPRLRKEFEDEYL